ncbi:MAG: GNAT superfamily N-acetyltransferase [Candidatus Azotimanducaceae bacterium]
MTNKCGSAEIFVATLEDVSQINLVIEQAVMAWPLSERLRRLSLPLLRYTEADWPHYQFLIKREHDSVVAIAAWDPHTRCATVHGHAALLHGLYVMPAWQGCGIGWRLIQEVAKLARALPVDGVLVKAERIAVSYFESRGLLVVAATDRQDYPYQFWLGLGQ